MISVLPDMQDGISYYIYTPYKESLYGADTRPMQFLRVTDPIPGEGLRQYREFQYDADDPSTICRVETVDVPTFLEWCTYGYTPYLEVAFCGLRNAFDFDPYSDSLISQSAFRNYEERCKTMLDLLDEKRFSLTSRMSGDDRTARLVSELKGALLMWEMLMNTGKIRAVDCLQYAPTDMRGSFPAKALHAKFDELGNRCVIGDFHNLEYKITQSKRDEIIGRFA